MYVKFSAPSFTPTLAIQPTRPALFQEVITRTLFHPVTHYPTITYQSPHAINSDIGPLRHPTPSHVSSLRTHIPLPSTTPYTRATIQYPDRKLRTRKKGAADATYLLSHAEAYMGIF